LLDVVRRGLRRQLRPEHALAGQVEVAAGLEHATGDDLADPLPLEAETGDQPVEPRGEHVLVGDVRVDAVGPREGDAVAADDREAPGGLLHSSSSNRWLGYGDEVGLPSSLPTGHIVRDPRPLGNAMRATSRKVDHELNR